MELLALEAGVNCHADAQTLAQFPHALRPYGLDGLLCCRLWRPEHREL